MTTFELMQGYTNFDVVQIIKKINYKKLDEFVNFTINRLYTKYGKDHLLKDIHQETDPNTPINVFFSHLIELGGLKLVLDNNLFLKFDRYALSFVVASSMNHSIALELVKLGFMESSRTRYYSLDAIDIYTSRIYYHLLQYEKDPPGTFSIGVNLSILQVLMPLIE